MSKEKLIEAITKAIPYSDQITNWDLTEADCVRFTWRGSRFRVPKSCHVEEVEGAFLSGSKLAILMRSLIKPAYYSLVD